MKQQQNRQDKGRSPSSSQLFKGYVVSVDAANATARIRVDDLGGMLSWHFPILQSRVKQDKGLYLVDVGDLVVAIADERLEEGYILGAFYTAENPPPQQSIDVWYHQFSDGTEIEYNRSTSTLTIEGPSQITIIGDRIDLNP